MNKTQSKFRITLLIVLSILVLAISLSAKNTYAQPGTIVVNSTADPGDGTCDQNQCTLREAIQLVNAGQEPMTITFAIPGNGPHTIRPLSPLPEISKSVLIDGYSQAGASANTNPIDKGLNTVLMIELDGSLTGGDGLTLSGGTSTVRGLAINRFSKNAILVNATGKLEGNFIGVDLTGRMNVGGGAIVAAPSSTLQLGDVTPAARNLIVGSINMVAGQIEMRGNLIGVDRSGLLFLGNSDIFAGRGRLIMGGTVPEARNIIIGKISVDLSYPADIQGNYLGVDVAGQKILGTGSSLDVTNNGSYRIINNVIKGSATNGVTFDTSYGSQLISNTIEGHAGSGVYIVDSLRSEIINNKIDGNGGAGIAMVRSFDSQNKISANSIFNNGGLGIDLGNDGVTLNDVGDVDVGNNQLQNFPELTSLYYEGNNNILVGALNSQPNTLYRVEIFYSLRCDALGYGEGEKFATGVDVLTDKSGNSQFGLKMGLLREGYYLTATATDPNGNTSEFSKCIRVQQPPATITIVKEAQPKSTQDFVYYGPFGKFLLDDVVPDDGDAVPNSMTYTVKPGTYNFAEGVYQTWYLADIICLGSGSSTKDMLNRSVAVTVQPRAEMTCTFVTQRRVNLQATKFNDLNADGLRQANEPTLTPWEFRFYTSDGTLINHKVTDANGSAVQNNVIPGSFKVCETPKAGWTNTLPGQVAPLLGVPCYSLTVLPGQNASLLFGNTQAAVVRHAEEFDPLSGVTIGELPDINEPESELNPQIFLPMISR